MHIDNAVDANNMIFWCGGAIECVEMYTVGAGAVLAHTIFVSFQSVFGLFCLLFLSSFTPNENDCFDIC